MNENPWCCLPAGPPYVLPGDASLVQNFNLCAGPNRFLHIEKILPEAFVGSRHAPVVLLSNNPGYTEQGAPSKQEAAFVAKMRNNLHHDPSPHPFVFLAPDYGGPGKKWWTSKLKDLLELFGVPVIARSILNVPYFP